ncbi:MAG: ISAzo13 family transposase, partial [Methylococcales bacterium]|nr:ISAzo13 family transposase [Methylococcales bacterium]
MSSKLLNLFHARSLAEGVAVPHTLYDMERNEAYVNIGTSRDTSEFSCDSIRHWW